MTRRQLREATGLGDTQLKVHLARLVDLELVTAHRAEKGSNFVYELCWDSAGREGGRFLAGLCDPNTLGVHDYDDSRSGPDGDRSAPGRPRSVGGRPPVGVAKRLGTSCRERLFRLQRLTTVRKALFPARRTGRS